MRVGGWVGRWPAFYLAAWSSYWSRAYSRMCWFIDKCVGIQMEQKPWNIFFSPFGDINPKLQWSTLTPILYCTNGQKCMSKWNKLCTFEVSWSYPIEWEFIFLYFCSWDEVELVWEYIWILFGCWAVGCFVYLGFLRGCSVQLIYPRHHSDHSRSPSKQLQNPQDPLGSWGRSSTATRRVLRVLRLHLEADRRQPYPL